MRISCQPKGDFYGPRIEPEVGSADVLMSLPTLRHLLRAMTRPVFGSRHHRPVTELTRARSTYDTEHI